MLARADDLYNRMDMVGDASYDGGYGNAIAGKGIFGATYDLQTSDDFTVPAGGFKIMEVEQASLTFVGTSPADVAIRIYADDGGTPEEDALYEKLAVADLGLSPAYETFTDTVFGYTGVKMTLSGLDITLGEGRYWLNIQPIDTSDTADWYYQLIDYDTLNGYDAHLRDGKSGYSGGYGLELWTPSAEFFDVPADLAMRISGVVPEPASCLLIALGGLGLLRRRR
jgi:hypothetical protein